MNSQITDSVATPSDTPDTNETQLETINVTADFRQLDLMQIPSSITVVGEDDIQSRNADHLESVLSLAPNVNFAAGASRGRFIQIRGIGERSQFVDPISPSVGLVIDGIDMTGLAGAATLFDIKQIEILRGPQGTAFGANALAGIINIKSTEQTNENSGFISARIGNYNSINLSGAIGTQINENLSARLALKTHTSNGYIENKHLNKKDTAGFDENTAKANLVWENHASRYKLNLIKVKTDNGYDAFTIDNTRNTQSDEPGKDTIDLTAASIQTSNQTQYFSIETNTEFSNSDSLYSYDYDWMNDGFRGHTGTDFEAFNRDTDKASFDIRLLSKPQSNILNNSTSWIIGAYTKSFDEDLTQSRIKNSAPTIYNNSFHSNSFALYSELTSSLTATTSMTYGLRIEEWRSNFADSEGLKDKHSETLFGGKISLDTLLNENHLAYISLSRGYKMGGFNSNKNLPTDLIKFNTEYNWATEIGLKSSLLNDELTTNIAIFHIKREDQQVKSSTVRDNGATFIDSINNAASGENFGLELEANWKISQLLTWKAAIGLLETEINGFTINIDTDGDWVNDATLDKSGRNQSHAPSYTFSTAIKLDLTNNLSANLELEGKDEFYFSDTHDAKSESFNLLHASIDYKFNNWSLALTGKNLTNVDTEVRGFSGWIQDPQYYVDPATAYTPNKYTQFGEPRLISLSARYDF
ncbi:TonB-dependent receptor [Oceaniserpentilla sp. 4NH20-0058]